LFADFFSHLARRDEDAPAFPGREIALAETARPGLLERLVVPAPLLAGALLSFVACCVLGRILSHHNQYKFFTRFHRYIQPETLYYPTASQVRGLARDRLDPEKIAVVVGGNSILNGVGQREREVWTRKLQKLLGEDYRVLNLAMVGAQPSEFGGVTAEILAKDYRRLIYVADLGSSTSSGDPDGLLYRYFFWDAHFKGMLPLDPDRDQRLVEIETDRAKKDSVFAELKTGRRLDGTLFFQDLWTTCALKKRNTVWTPQMAGKPFTAPRQTFADPEVRVRSVREARLEPDERSLDIVRGCAVGFPGLVLGKLLPPVGAREGVKLDPDLSPLARNARACFPPEVRSHSLLLVLRDSPHVVNRLEPPLKADYDWAQANAARMLELAGFASLAVGQDFTEDDFVDRCHLSEEGGRKLASKVAPKVRELAGRLGFLESP
jgi:hypothetical protein